jgi:hypothetical protein
VDLSVRGKDLRDLIGGHVTRNILHKELQFIYNRACNNRFLT